ncbi:hypothetical protein [Nitrosospira briensis]|nr:hypothetical protein [Nitrosospira briensis]
MLLKPCLFYKARAAKVSSDINFLAQLGIDTKRREEQGEAWRTEARKD